MVIYHLLIIIQPKFVKNTLSMWIIYSTKLRNSGEFFKAYSKIPRKKQSKVADFIEKFKNNPTSSAINYEKILNSSDPNMRSVRIDNSYRGIVLKPEKGNV